MIRLTPSLRDDRQPGRALDPEGGYIVLTTVTDRVGHITFFQPSRVSRLPDSKSVRSLARYDGSSLPRTGSRRYLCPGGTGRKVLAGGKRLATESCGARMRLGLQLRRPRHRHGGGTSIPSARAARRRWWSRIQSLPETAFGEKVPKVRWQAIGILWGPRTSARMARSSWESDKGNHALRPVKASARPTHEGPACQEAFPSAADRLEDSGAQMGDRRGSCPELRSLRPSGAARSGP